MPMTRMHTPGPCWRDDDDFIAAFSEMFDALELCVDALAELSRLDDGTCSVSALIRAREALAKARPG